MPSRARPSARSQESSRSPPPAHVVHASLLRLSTVRRAGLLASGSMLPPASPPRRAVACSRVAPRSQLRDSPGLPPGSLRREAEASCSSVSGAKPPSRDATGAEPVLTGTMVAARLAVWPNGSGKGLQSPLPGFDSRRRLQQALALKSPPGPLAAVALEGCDGGLYCIDTVRPVVASLRRSEVTEKRYGTRSRLPPNGAG